MNTRLFVFTLLFSLLVSAPRTARAQAGLSISGQQVSYLFGEHIAFQARLDSQENVASVEIVFREQHSPETIVLPAELRADGKVLGLYAIEQDNRLQAFSAIAYWFRVQMRSNSLWESETYSFNYLDNRFEWTHLEEGPLHIYTQQDDRRFAQAVMEAARKGLDGVYQLLDAPVPEDMRVYVYSDPDDLQSALNLERLSWVAGHADPVKNLALVSIPSGQEQQAEIERQIPHEVAHLMLYQMTGRGYYSLPVWLNEGLASNLELTSSPDLRGSLDQAVAAGELIQMSELCAAFPAEASEAALAYAQSESFVRFLISRYGRSGMNALVDSYAAGEGCERGLLTALGSDLDFLEREWRALQFQEDPLRLALSQIGLWLTLFLLGTAGPISFVVAKWRRERNA